MGVVSNKIKREELKAGDHIYSWRLAYTYAHHGIYDGKGKVIHFTQGTSKETGTGTVLDRVIFSSAPFHPLDIPCPNCGDQSKLHGVISSCIDCFLYGGNLYCFEYGVTPVLFLAQVRGGTCTTAHSDPPEDVLHRASYLLQNGFGGYHIFRNNCEDFAIYCKTSLLVTPSIDVGCSGQAASFHSLLFAASGISFRYLTPALSGAGTAAAAVGMYCASRLANDIGVRSNVAKVSVEKLVAEFDLSKSNSEGGSEIGATDSLSVESPVAESGLRNSDSKAESEIGTKDSLPVETPVAESRLSNSDSEGGSEIGKKDSLPVERLIAESRLGNADSKGGSEIAMGCSGDVEFRCFVGGLAWATTDQALKEAFSQIGKILESKIINDRESGRSRGFGFVTFSNEKSMRDAIKDMNGQNIDGRKITVKEAQSRRSRGSDGYSRRGAGGAYRRGGGGRGEGGYYRGGGHNGYGGGGSYRGSSRGGGYEGGYSGRREHGYGDGGPCYLRGGGASDGGRREGSYKRGGGGGGDKYIKVPILAL